MSMREASPLSWPFVRGRPLALAQRPLPSITTATWRGTNSSGIAGGRVPDGCGGGATTGARSTGASSRRRRIAISASPSVDRRQHSAPSPLDQPQRADLPFQVPLQVGGDDPAGLPTAPALAGV